MSRTPALLLALVMWPVAARATTSDRLAALEARVNALESTVSTQQTRIAALEAALDEEVEARLAAEAVLQAAIDAVSGLLQADGTSIELEDGAMTVSTHDEARLSVLDETVVPLQLGPVSPITGTLTGGYDLGALVAPFRTVYSDALVLAGRVGLIYHASDYIESTGAFLIRKGDLGFRAIGSDGMNGLIMSVTDGAAVISAENGTGPRIRSLVLAPGSGLIEFAGVHTQDAPGGDAPKGYLTAVVNGEEVALPYYAH